MFAVWHLAVAAVFPLDSMGGGLPFVLAVGAYTVGAYRPLREVVFAAAVQNVALYAMLVADGPDSGLAEYVTSVPVFAATMVVGSTMQSRRLQYDA